MSDIREYFDVDTFVKDLTDYKAKQGITVQEMAVVSDINPTTLRELYAQHNWHQIKLITFLKLCQACDLLVPKYLRF